MERNIKALDEKVEAKQEEMKKIENRVQELQEAEMKKLQVGQNSGTGDTED